MGVPVPQLMEAVVEVTPQESMQNRMPEQIVGCPRASDHRGPRGRYAYYTSGARAELHAGADRGCPRASDLGGPRGSCVVSATGTRAESHAGADRGCPRAPDHGGQLAVRTTGTRAELHAGADRGFPRAPDHGRQLAGCTTGTRAESHARADRGYPRAPDHGDSLPFVPQERVQNRTLEQIVDFPVPRTMEAIVEVVPSLPQERVQNRTLEQIVGVPVPRTMEERVPSRIQEQIMDLPVPQIMVASEAYTGKVFTVDMCHHRGDQAYPVDTVGVNIKGLDMEIPVPQIAEEIVERPLPLVHEAARKFFEQHTLEDGLISWGHLGSLSSSWTLSGAAATTFRDGG